MIRFLTPTLRITIGLLSLTLSLIMIAYSFGLLPNEEKGALESRARISENLAIQLANLASSNESSAIRATIDSMRSRSNDVLSVGIRDANGTLLIASENHAELWGQQIKDKSTPTHVQVPLFDGGEMHGKIELVFKPLAIDGTFLGVPKAFFGFLAFVAFAGFVGYNLILKRALRELDPRNAVPERVKAAFDTLAEGLLIVDDRGSVLLANSAFLKNVQPFVGVIEGLHIRNLPWELPGNATQRELPWETALRTVSPVIGAEIGLRCGDRQLRKLSLNATPISDGNSAVRGLIITCDDITKMHQINSKLSETINELQISQVKISDQNEKLKILASTDPLTGCLNRRVFFEEAERALKTALDQKRPLSFLMIDADHFKSINDRFGHAVGDKVLLGLGEMLRRVCQTSGAVGRYGGEEFCVVISGLAENSVEQLAEHIRSMVAATTSWLPNEGKVTISIGICLNDDGQNDISELVKRADEALYAAKASGRNRVVNWRCMPVVEPPASIVSESPEAASGRLPTERRKSPDAVESGGGLVTIEQLSAKVEFLRCGDHEQSGFALAHINVDNFRYFNECYGQQIADDLLEKIAHRIVMRIRSGDMIARLGGDEFLILIRSFDERERIHQVLDRVLKELKYPFVMQSIELFGAFSVGVSVFPKNGSTFEILRKNAEAAMRRAKRGKGGKLIFFEEGMNQVDADRMKAEQALQFAIRDRKFCCAFQPKVDISTHQVIGFEALVRWRDDNGEIHSPGEFIDMAIELGLIDQITNVVLKISIDSFSRLDSAFGTDTTLSINIASQLADKCEFMLPFARKIKDSGYAHRIILEFTEESFISRGALQTEIIPILHDLGVRVSIDDFGVGHSSLSTLADIEADELKIDRSFISRIHERPRNQSILRSITSLAESLNMTIVAEGVETYEELAFLHAATNIRYAQGFYFSRPFYLDDMTSAKRFFVESEPAKLAESRAAKRMLIAG